MAKKDEDTTYLLEMHDGSQKKITVPSNWTLTFGALIPGQATNGGRLGLRLWGPGKVQKAVFQNVEAFRDMSLVLEERVTTTKQEAYRKGDGANAKEVILEAVVHEWVNPDAPKQRAAAEEPKQLRVVSLD